MRPLPMLVLLTICSGVTLATVASTEPLDEAAIHAEAQYYLMSLPSAPVEEIAEAVLGEALGLPYSIDADVDARMAFKVDGLYAPKALAQEFGHHLWAVDVALIERPSRGLELIPKSELATALRQGASPVSAMAVVESQISEVSPSPTKRSEEVAAATETSWSWAGWLLAGWIGGAASVIGVAIHWARRPARTSLQGQEPSRPLELGSPDLIIPTFPPCPAAETQPKRP